MPIRRPHPTLFRMPMTSLRRIWGAPDVVFRLIAV